MVPGADIDHGFPLPVSWCDGVTRSFVEVPVDRGRFESIEIQSIEHDGKRGHLVMLHRPGGALEIYPEPHLNLDEAWFYADPAFAHFDLAALQDTNFDAIRCAVGGAQVDAFASFVDASGRQIVARAGLKEGSESKPLFTPAPHQSSPYTLRFLAMNEFRLLPVRSTGVSVSDEGVPLRPSPFLSPLAKCAPYYAARAGADLILAGLLTRHDDKPTPVLDVDSPQSSEIGDSVATFDGDRLRSLRISRDFGFFELNFDCPLPNPAIDVGCPQSGRFEVRSSIGVAAAGMWVMAWDRSGVEFSLNDVCQDWAPPLSQPTRLALRYARRFRRRNKSWEYRCRLRSVNGSWRSTGSWSVHSEGK